jgi:hypothetical protein
MNTRLNRVSEKPGELIMIYTDMMPGRIRHEQHAGSNLPDQYVVLWV